METVGVFNLDYYYGICHSYVNDFPISSFGPLIATIPNLDRQEISYILLHIGHRHKRFWKLVG